MRTTILVPLFLFLCFINEVFASDFTPEQIHLAYGYTPDIMAVQWATYETFCTSGNTVRYGLDKNNLDMSATASCFPFNLGPTQLKQSNHIAYLNNLKGSTYYYYQIYGSDAVEDISEIFHFKSAPDAASLDSSFPHRFLVFGDLAYGTNRPLDVPTIMPWASAEVQQDKFDMILALGDFAYNFDSIGGSVGRIYMNEIQNMTSLAPMMVNAGNHESAFKFAHYTEFFRSHPSNQLNRTVTTDNGVAPNNWYYSFNMGIVHFVTVATEIYWDNQELIDQQLAWLKEDLEEANKNRTVAPWIIVNGHKSMYCSCDEDCDNDAARLRTGYPVGSSSNGIEQLMYDYGVDLFLNGHEHNYERMYDVAPHETYNYLAGITTQSTTNPPAPIYIICRNNEIPDHEEFIYPQPNRTAFRSDAISYSRMTIYNSTHLYWDQVECDMSKTPMRLGEVIDSFWLIQYKHGPFGQKEEIPPSDPTDTISTSHVSSSLSKTNSIIIAIVAVFVAVMLASVIWKLLSHNSAKSVDDVKESFFPIGPSSQKTLMRPLIQEDA